MSVKPRCRKCGSVALIPERHLLEATEAIRCMVCGWRVERAIVVDMPIPKVPESLLEKAPKPSSDPRCAISSCRRVAVPGSGFCPFHRQRKQRAAA